MTDIVQETFSDEFSWKKMLVFYMLSNFFPRFQLAISPYLVHVIAWWQAVAFDTHVDQDHWRHLASLGHNGGVHICVDKLNVLKYVDRVDKGVHFIPVFREHKPARRSFYYNFNTLKLSLLLRVRGWVGVGGWGGGGSGVGGWGGGGGVRGWGGGGGGGYSLGHDLSPYWS